MIICEIKIAKLSQFANDKRNAIIPETTELKNNGAESFN